MRYLITGGHGMLGCDLQAALVGHDVTALGHAELDVTDPEAVAAAVAGMDVVVNAAAFTRVDDAEAHESAATAVNGLGAGIIAAAARHAGAIMVQVSTDYVFDGAGTSPYAEDHPIAPLGAYGRSKAVGERLVAAAQPDSYIVRTAWLYGANGPNFARTMLRLAANQDTVSVVNDQIGQPTWTADLAAAIASLVHARPAFGIYHVTNSGEASWFDFAQAIFSAAGLDPERVIPTLSSKFVRPAPRPAYSVLGHRAWDRAGLQRLRSWRDALAAASGAGILA